MKKKFKNLFNDDLKFTSSEVFILMIIVGILCVGITISIYKFNEKEEKAPEGFEEVLNTYDFIMKNYYKDLNSETIINGAIKGMLEATGDKYTMYLDDNQSNTIDVLLEGSYEGLGVQVANTKDSEHIYITGIIKNSPAASSELQIGDEVISINDQNFKGKTTTELVKYIKTSKDSKFKMVVLRDNENKTIYIERKFIELESVSSEVIEKNNKKIGYIYISLFANNTDIQFAKTLNELEHKNIDALILDVRDNSGGHLTSVSNMISQFVDSSHIIFNIEDNKVITPTYSTGNVNKTYPIVILINNNSASASEVMAGSLKDNLKAYLIGETTYGKGTVQQLLTLPNGDYYKVTTQKWLTPKKTWVNEKGLKPDLEVKLNSTYDGTNETDNQLQSALDYLTK